MIKNLKAFIEELATMEVTPNVYNQYSFEYKENSIRRDNLLIYLKQMRELNPKLYLQEKLQDIGEKHLLKIIDMFSIEKVIAMGNKAEESLNKLGIGCEKVRHPAQGGKNEFVDGIRSIKETSNL